MFSSKVCGSLPKDQKHGHMSYMYGPHMSSTHVYFGGDNRVVYQPNMAIELRPPPAWLLADWLLAQKRGEPLSQVAQYSLTQRAHWNRNLHWLDQFLNS